MPDEHLTPNSHATIQVHEALIRQLVAGQDRLIFEVGKVGNLLARGDERFKNLEESHEDVDGMKKELAVLSSQYETLRLIVYGGVGLTLIGMLSTLGVVVLWALRSMGKLA